MPGDDFLVSRIQRTILALYGEREGIQLEPEYQRAGAVWSREKRQLLIDSLLNGFDVPKMYFHEFVPPKRIGKAIYRYSIIDGQQRLRTIWGFIDGEFRLADDFEYLRDGSVKAGGLKYAALAASYPELKSRFDGTQLDIVSIQTEDLELIEEMFSRLNEAVPLNAPEKRNAFGGPLPNVIRKVAQHDFFVSRVPFKDSRYRHRDLAAKFLYIEHEDAVVNTKKSDLDIFVKKFKGWRESKDTRAAPRTVAELRARTEEVLDSMSEIFWENDGLLRQVGLVTLYFYVYKAVRDGRAPMIDREMLEWFETQRRLNRAKAEAGSERLDQELMEFDRHSQTPNDAYAFRIRLAILLRHLARHFRLKIEPSLVKAE